MPESPKCYPPYAIRNTHFAIRTKPALSQAEGNGEYWRFFGIYLTANGTVCIIYNKMNIEYKIQDTEW